MSDSPKICHAGKDKPDPNCPIHFIFDYDDWYGADKTHKSIKWKPKPLPHASIGVVFDWYDLPASDGGKAAHVLVTARCVECGCPVYPVDTGVGPYLLIPECQMSASSSFASVAKPSSTKSKAAGKVTAKRPAKKVKGKNRSRATSSKFAAGKTPNGAQMYNPPVGTCICSYNPNNYIISCAPDQNCTDNAGACTLLGVAGTSTARCSTCNIP